MKTTLVIGSILAVVLAVGTFTNHAMACPQRDKHSGRAPGPDWMGPRHGDHGFSHGKKLMHLAMKLDLSPQQGDRVRSIIKTHMSRSIDVMWSLAQSRRDLKQLMHDEKTDEKTVRDAATRMGNAIAEATVIKSQLRQQIHEALTPEQLEQLKELKELRHQPRSKKCPKCGKGKNDPDRKEHQGHHGHADPDNDETSDN